MVNQPQRAPDELEELRRTVGKLQDALRRMQVERESAARARRKRLVMVAVPVSLVLHLILMAYLAMMYRAGDGDGGQGPIAIEFAMVHDSDLTGLDELDTSDLLHEEVDLSAPSLDASDLSLDASLESAELSQATPSDVEGLVTASDVEGGLSGGGGGTSYFGVSARGTRFAYIVDRSGSMSFLNRMPVASAELVKSIQSLPDYAYFYVLFFSSDIMVPPMQSGWLAARRQNVASMVRWINQVDPGGGTLPRTSFHDVFALDPLPDVIFFMTDGIIAESALTAGEVASLNRSRKRVVINTIAFGDQGSEDLLRRIARDSGGTYRYIPDRESSP